MLTAAGTLADPVEGISSLHDATAMCVDFLTVRVVPHSSGGNPTCCSQDTCYEEKNCQEVHGVATFRLGHKGYDGYLSYTSV